MKPFFQLCLLLLSNYCWSQQSVDTFKFPCSIIPLREIAFSDTVKDNHGRKVFIYNYDKEGKAVSVVEVISHSSKNIRSTTTKVVYYNTGNNVIAETIGSNGFLLHCFSFAYDNKGRLISKEGFSSGLMGVRVEYEYDSTGKLIKEVTHSPSGVIVKRY